MEKDLFIRKYSRPSGIFGIGQSRGRNESGGDYRTAAGIILCHRIKTGSVGQDPGFKNE